jgi:hypothetical protein
VNASNVRLARPHHRRTRRAVGGQLTGRLPVVTVAWIGMGIALYIGTQGARKIARVSWAEIINWLMKAS